MLVEAVRSAASVPGPLRAVFLRIEERKGQNVVAVAKARKIAALIWHLLKHDEPCRWARPAFVAKKMRRLALRAGAPKEHGHRTGPGRDYRTREIRHREMDLVPHAGASCVRMVEA